MTLSQAERIEIESAAHRYFAGRMSEAETEDFEIRMLEDAEIAREVEATRRLRAGMRRLQASGEIGSFTRARPGWQSPMSLAAAAAVVIVVLASMFYFARLTHPVSVLALEPRSPTVSGTYVLAQRRGASTDVVIQMTRPATAVQLDVLPTEVSKTGEYRLELSEAAGDSSGKSLGRVTARADKQGLVTVFLDTSRLTAGRYVLNFAAAEPGAAPTAYTLVLED
jgi:hypothetical protein